MRRPKEDATSIARAVGAGTKTRTLVARAKTFTETRARSKVDIIIEDLGWWFIFEFLLKYMIHITIKVVVMKPASLE